MKFKKMINNFLFEMSLIVWKNFWLLILNPQNLS
jgi:hypothetical protein